jgi:hypothetical protein
VLIDGLVYLTWLVLRCVVGWFVLVSCYFVRPRDVLLVFGIRGVKLVPRKHSRLANSPLRTPAFLAAEVARLIFIRGTAPSSEPPYVGCYFFIGLLDEPKLSHITVEPVLQRGR